MVLSNQMHVDEESEVLLPRETEKLSDRLSNRSKTRPLWYHPMVILVGSVLILFVLFSIAYEISNHFGSGYLMKPTIDKRQYRNFELSNGLKVLAISDPDIRSTSIALSVQVGAFMDPDNMIGRAHFLEHLVFLGSHKYPGLDSFKTYVTRHGGNYNAFTNSEETNFHFQIPKPSFEKALDMFIQMLVDPIFTREWAGNEVAAVDGEYSIDIHKDGWKTKFAMKLASNPKTPFYRMECGNTQTLISLPEKNDVDIIGSIKDFFEKYYSSNLMSLAIIHNKPIDDIQDLVKRQFSLIQNKQVDKPTFIQYPKPFEGEYANRLIQYVPGVDSRSGFLLFCTDPSLAHPKSNPLDYIYTIINAGGPGSLSSVLRNKGWIVELKASSQVKTSYFELPGIIFSLTRSGIQNLEGISRTVFAYLDLIRHKGITKELFDHFSHISKYTFDYSQYKDSSEDAMEEVTLIASKMNEFPIKYALGGDKVLSSFDPMLMLKFLDQMNPKNLLMIVTDPDFGKEKTDGLFVGLEEASELKTKVVGGSLEMKEVDKYDPVYQLRYAVSDLPADFLESLSQVSYKNHPELRLPEKNSYVPRNFKMAGSDCMGARCVELFASDRSNKVKNIVNDTNVRVWHLLERSFGVPITTCYIKLNYVQGKTDLLTAVASGIMRELATVALSRELVQMKAAGHSVTFENKYIKIEAFSEAFPKILQTILSKYKTPEYDETHYEIAKASFITYIDNKFKDNADAVVEEMQNRVFMGKSFTSSDVRSHANQLDYDDFKKLLNSPDSSSDQLEVFFYGNILEDEAKQHGIEIAKVLNPKPVQQKAVQEASFIQSSVLNSMESNLVLREPAPGVDRDVTMTLNYYQDGPVNPKDLATLKILSKILSPEAFSYLRTEKKLGYTVQLQDIVLKGIMGLGVLIMSAGYDQSTVDKEIDNFWVKAEKVLEKMTEDEVVDLVTSYTDKLSYDSKSFRVKADDMFRHIEEGDYVFDAQEELKTQLPNVNKSELEKHFKRLLMKPMKMSFQMYGEDEPKALQGLI